jgi:hypothetical protein
MAAGVPGSVEVGEEHPMLTCDLCGHERPLVVMRGERAFCAHCIEDLYWDLEDKRDDVPPEEWALIPTA